jgi:hypothetical protein
MPCYFKHLKNRKFWSIQAIIRSWNQLKTFHGEIDQENHPETLENWAAIIFKKNSPQGVRGFWAQIAKSLFISIQAK